MNIKSSSKKHIALVSSFMDTLSVEVKLFMTRVSDFVLSFALAKIAKQYDIEVDYEILCAETFIKKDKKN